MKLTEIKENPDEHMLLILLKRYIDRGDGVIFDSAGLRGLIDHFEKVPRGWSSTGIDKDIVVMYYHPEEDFEGKQDFNMNRTDRTGVNQRELDDAVLKKTETGYLLTLPDYED